MWGRQQRGGFTECHDLLQKKQFIVIPTKYPPGISKKTPRKKGGPRGVPFLEKPPPNRGGKKNSLINLLSDHTNLFWEGGLYQCWAVLRKKERYPLVVNLSMYVHLPNGPQKFEITGFGIQLWFSMGFFKSQRTSQKTHRFFASSFVRTTGSLTRLGWKQPEPTVSLTLNSFQRTGTQRFFDSEISKELELLTGLWFWNIWRTGTGGSLRTQRTPAPPPNTGLSLSGGKANGIFLYTFVFDFNHNKYIIVDLFHAGWQLNFTPSIRTLWGKLKILLSNQIKSDTLTDEILSKGKIWKKNEKFQNGVIF